MTPLIKVKDLRVRRGHKTILEVGHLSIEHGEVLALIGPNGAGKTTLLLALARLIRPTAGEITFNNHVIAPANAGVARSALSGGTSFVPKSKGDDEAISLNEGVASSGKERPPRNDILAYRRRIGLVMQDPLLLDRSVFENVAIGLKFRGTHRDEIQTRVTEWLTRLGIAHLRERRSVNLSGGEAQRVALARAFVLQPELLLLDEPFSALDAPTRARLLEDLKTLLAETRITTVFVTHDLGEARTLGQRVAVLMRGTIRQLGTPEAVFGTPVDAEVAAFAGAPPSPNFH